MIELWLASATLAANADTHKKIDGSSTTILTISSDEMEDITSYIFSRFCFTNKRCY